MMRAVSGGLVCAAYMAVIGSPLWFAAAVGILGVGVAKATDQHQGRE